MKTQKTKGFYDRENDTVHIFIPPAPTESERGGITAKEKTTESLEVTIDSATGKAYVALDKTLSKTGEAADAAVVGEKLTSMGVAIENVKEDLGNKITKFYASNQGETHLADSDNGKIMDMMVYGKSEQEQYSGKNLLNYNAWKGTPITRGTAIYENNGITLTATENDCYSEMGNNFPDNAKIKVSEGETLTLSWEQIENNKEGYIYIFGNGIASNSVNIDNRKSKKLSYTVPSGVTFITFRFGVATTGDTISYKNIQIEKGSEPTTYEPYTGGIPSPNPDYPQEIKSVVNPTVKVCGKNLFQPLMPTTTVDGVTVTNNGDGTYTLNGTAIANATFHLDQSGYGKADNLKKYKGTYTFSRSNTSYEARVMQHNTWKQVMYLGIGSQSITKKIDIDDCFVFINTSKGTTYNNVLVDLQIEFGSTATAFEPYHEQTATLPYTLNAIPVSSGGNVTIDGQQYIADYVDVERGKLVKMVDSSKLDNTQSIVDKTEWLLAEQQEIDLTQEEVQALKTLATYYPTTYISVNSEQLDGYTVFNYPISMENGWNYVKQQIGDTREYIYDMDLQSAEAYVNSEYAVALTELEV